MNDDTTVRAAGRLSLALVILLTAGPAWAATPSTLQVQGTLQVKGGVAVDGPYTLSFGLYGVDKAGSASWSEKGVKVTVENGHFSYTLGTANPIPGAALAGGNAWLGVRVGTDPELPRARLHAVAYARHAAAAEDLQCTGCVSVKEIVFDADVDLASRSLSAAKIMAKSVVAATVAASSFVGDGSKLTGIKLPVGTCPKGQAVVGIKADGSLQCAKTLTSGSLPNDVLDTVSNGQLTNKFVDTTAGAKTAVPIKDNNPMGTSDSVDLPDIGTVRELTVRIKLSNSGLKGVEIALFDPANTKHVLLAKGQGTGKTLDATWPKPTKQQSGDLSSWIGKNAKGKWRLLVTDTEHLNNKFDGAIEAWHIAVHTLSNNKVEAKGTLWASNGLVLQRASKVPFACSAAGAGYIYYDTAKQSLKVCNGEEWASVGVGSLGSSTNPAQDCKQLHKVYPNKPTGTYWLRRGGQLIKAHCDMDTDGGGWTLLLTLTHPRDQYLGSKHPLGTDLNVALPSPAAAYSRDWRGLFKPVKGTEFLMKRGVTKEWVRFVTNSFCGFASTDAGVCSGCHGTYASGCVIDSKGKSLGCNNTWLNSCSSCGGCQSAGCDTLAFNINHADYAGLFNNSMTMYGSGWHGSQCYGAWGSAGQQGDVFPQTTWIR